jgi:hypothetical protein
MGPCAPHARRRPSARDNSSSSGSGRINSTRGLARRSRPGGAARSPPPAGAQCPLPQGHPYSLIPLRTQADVRDLQVEEHPPLPYVEPYAGACAGLRSPDSAFARFGHAKSPARSVVRRTARAHWRTA